MCGCPKIACSSPIRLLDRYVKGGFGIMIDDVVAGAFAFVCMQVLQELRLIA